MSFDEIKAQLEKYKEEGKSLFTTSSFQSHSIVLLHILSRIDKSIPVVFINTGYHFPETVEFKDRVADLFGLNTVDLKSETPKFMQKDAEGRLLFTSDPDHCCFLNKTQPVNRLLMQHDVWINGVRADQSAVRKAMQVEQPAPNNAVRFHPMLDWNAKMIYQYQKEYDLPKHPLENSGYLSIGCEPCTRKVNPDMMEREARWYGMNKTECGLHTDLVSK
ncbi:MULTISPECIES: phosphoadenylyl-sulfate reductase [Fulvivirga]|uniref:Adenosine 5'-phosphosulfate reductase n=1 Tax=Fulvivirga sediminis TaxID=2803949 RepID=A0A937FAW1_9BACT|nr:MULTISPECIES: phosphoadenylyl-sulfate reductase [Fulvivirga]MBL3657469.1 phosphoadenylyl-sulfate reductase [Fulvivirga sediminis]UII26571.1 phosphoadenylyl-sulfate reductase [Fulvivirga maritima]